MGRRIGTAERIERRGRSLSGIAASRLETPAVSRAGWLVTALLEAGEGRCRGHPRAGSSTPVDARGSCATRWPRWLAPSDLRATLPRETHVDPEGASFNGDASAWSAEALGNIPQELVLEQ